METNSRVLQEELEQYRKEKEKIRDLVGQIGGVASARRDKIFNIIFISAICVLFFMDTLRHLLGISIPLSPLFSVELGLLLVSIKIIWMIYKQAKVEHFQFWILNSIEFRVNAISKQLYEIKAKLEGKE